jgi:hypothetical protein
MLRVRFDKRTWLLSEDEFLNKIDELARCDFADAPAGRVAVEGVDELDRVQWRSFYTNAAGLGILAREIRAGRAAQALRRQP